jgi:hypothetical protein
MDRLRRLHPIRIRQSRDFPLSREGLQSLLAAATVNPRPFDYVVMDGSYRLGRTFKKFRNVTELFFTWGYLYISSQRN